MERQLTSAVTIQTETPDDILWQIEIPYNALYEIWVANRQPRFLMYNEIVYMAIKDTQLEFKIVERGAYPERQDHSHRWDGNYGPYGRRWRRTPNVN